ncbi:hypothetical protein AAEH85_08260 [Shewanella algae]|uniref:nucleotidyltransferase domain-containing protein n=1 Tax=Shewanella algae TaxID=38313 RepID=UPI00313D1B92
MKELRLNKDVNELIMACMEFDPTIEAIFLYGGYGRGEGAWIDKNDKYLCPYNDYDLLVISNKKIDKLKLKVLREGLAKKLEISWVDISYMTPQKLKKLKPSIFNYDLIHGSTLIYGDKNILTSLPNINSSSITLKDVRILFFTRMFTLIGCCDLNAFSSGIEAGDDVRFFRSQLAKCIFAGIDALLISENQYDSSYKKRIERVKLLDKESNRHQLFDFAIEHKLSPSDKAITAECLQSIYNMSFDFYCESMFFSLAKYYGVSTIDFVNVKNKYISEPSILARRAFHFFTRSNYFENVLKSDLIQLAYMFASPNNINDRCAQQYLIEKLSLNGPYNIENHEIVRNEAVKLRLSL